MQNETLFQGALVLSMVAFLAIRAYYRRKTGTLRLDVSASRDSRRMRIFLLVLGVLFVGLFVWLINPAWMSWAALPLPEWLRWVGAGVVVIALALLIWAHQTLSASFSGNLEIREQHKLITTGPYQWIRHPIYTAIMLWALGLALITANWFVACLPIAFAVFFWLRVPLEEKMMLEGFGNEYGEYLKRTARFLPGL